MYERILIAVGTSPVAREAVREGVALARVHRAEVLFFTVLPRYVVPVADVPPVGLMSPEVFQREARLNAHRLLAAARTAAEKAGVRCHTAVGSGDDDAKCIAEAARKRRCGLIVAATASRSALMRLIGGSLIPGLISHATVPVLVVRPPEAPLRPARTAVKPPTAPKAATAAKTGKPPNAAPVRSAVRGAKPTKGHGTAPTASPAPPRRRSALRAAR